MEISSNVRQYLLFDHTLAKNFSIDPDKVIPRYKKVLSDQKFRTNDKAEVFTPYEIVKKMNDSFDSDFKGNDEIYINRKVLEVTCGEGPFLTTIYDVATGEPIPVPKRVGLLDRKLRRIPADTPEKWLYFASVALKSTYGYEWQEDSLYLARMNVLQTVIDFYVYNFNSYPRENYLISFAKIISYNLFRMDGITMCVPETDIRAKVMNWETNTMERFDGKPEELSLW